MAGKGKWAFVRAAQLKKKVGHLTDALARYGRHLPECMLFRKRASNRSAFAGRKPGACDCGFEQLVEEFVKPDASVDLGRKGKNRG